MFTSTTEHVRYAVYNQSTEDYISELNDNYDIIKVTSKLSEARLMGKGSANVVVDLYGDAAWSIVEVTENTSRIPKMLELTTSRNVEVEIKYVLDGGDLNNKSSVIRLRNLLNNLHTSIDETEEELAEARSILKSINDLNTRDEE